MNDQESWQPEEVTNPAQNLYDINPQLARNIDIILQADRKGEGMKDWRGIAGEIGLTGKDILNTVWKDRHTLDTDDAIRSFKDIMGYFKEIRMTVNQAIANGKLSRDQRSAKIQEILKRPIMVTVKL